jgi:hypothetical protein
MSNNPWTKPAAYPRSSFQTNPLTAPRPIQPIKPLLGAFGGQKPLKRKTVDPLKPRT